MSDLEPTVQSTPAGWYPDQQNPQLVRYWDGASWTENRAPAQQSVPQVVVSGPMASVAMVPVQTSHTFHLIMTILTCGLWGLFVWLPMTVINAMRKKKVVTRYR